jgi:hypothetical protein
VKKTVRVAFGIYLAAMFTFGGGCGGRPSKAEIEKRVKAALVGDWKDVKYETRANDTVSVVLAARTVNGKTYEYSFTGGGEGCGVAVRNPTGQWLAKYRFEKGAEVASEKMDGTDDDVKAFRSTATELASKAMKACE